MISDPTIKKSIIASIIASIFVIIFIQPLINFLWNIILYDYALNSEKVMAAELTQA
jgi:hypothetical protein